MIEPAFQQDRIRFYLGDCREILPTLPESSVNTCVTSPPYWGLRDYGHENQVGQEKHPQEFVEEMVTIFREVRRVLRDDGTLWLNLGDSYATGGGAVGRCPGGGEQGERFLRAGMVNTQPNRMKLEGFKAKDLVGIPWRVALALQADGWYLRQDIIWHKPNPMPESVRDRCTKSHEYIFLLSKSERYYFDSDAIKEPAEYAGQMRGGSTNRYEQNAAGMDSKIYDTRNKRSVWTVALKHYKGAHFATYPQELIQPCIKAGCPENGTVLDPFLGSGTTAQVALENGCQFVGCELNPDYLDLAKQRFDQPRLIL